MNYQKGYSKKILVYILLFIGCFGFLTNNQLMVNAENTPNMNVYFISVGQGDCQLIESDGKYLLIDSGPLEAGDTVANFLKSKNIKKLDYVISTHPHVDHLGGFLTSLKDVEVGTLFMPNVSYTTKTYKNFLDLIWNKNIPRRNPYIGTSFELGTATVKFLSPKGSFYEDLNNYSIVVRITNGENSFLFTGDTEKEAENEMLQSGYTLKSDVLKVAHHSSRSSSTQAFIDAVDPDFSVISLGLNNEFGFPKSSTLKRLKYSNVYRTDLQGNVRFHSDGKEITVDKKPIISAVPKGYSGDIGTLSNTTVSSDLDDIQLLATNESNTYELLSTEPVKLEFEAEYGVSSKGNIYYMLVKSGEAFNQNGTWKKGDSVTINHNFKGRVYVKYTNKVGNTLIRKTNGFSVDLDGAQQAEVYSPQLKLKMVSLSQENTYERYSNKKTTLNFDADFGPSGKESIEYMFVKKGLPFDEDEGWDEGTRAIKNEDFVGRVYVRFTDKAGNETIKKTTGFTIDKEKPNNCTVKSSKTSSKISLIDYNKKNSYTITARQKLSLSFQADFGTSGRKSIQYKLVKKGTAFNKNGTWKTGTQVTINKGFEGSVYVKFTDKAGNITYKKTKGFVVK